MDIENLTLINTDPITSGVREVIIGVITAIIVFYLLYKRQKTEDIRIENLNNERKVLKGQIYEHKKMLLETVIRDWYGIEKPSSLAEQQHTKEHLRTGYYHLWKLWFEDRKSILNHISEDKKIIKEYIKHKSMEGMPLYSKLDNIFDDVFISKNEYGEIVRRAESDEIYKLVDDFATSGELIEDEDYKEFVEIIIQDTPLYEVFKRVRENKKDLNKKIDEFVQGLEKIVCDFEEKDSELGGTCKKCGVWYDKLKSLK